MTLRVVYRSYGGDNDKERPPFFSKERALQSLVRAAGVAGCEVVFVNDGPVPDALVALMRSVGEVVTLPSVGMQQSFLAGLRMPLERRWSDDDVVYLCEDDYLHVPDALVRLRAAGERLDADYLTLYGLSTERSAGSLWDREARPEDTYVPPGWAPAAPVGIDGVTWAAVPASTSTFAARVGALRADLGIFRLAMYPHRTMYRDRDMCLTYQGHRSHEWSVLGKDVFLRSAGPYRDRVRAAALVPFKAAMNLRALRRPENRHTLLAPFPNLATHLETAFLGSDRDWAQVARDTDAWVAARPGRPTPAPVPDA